jgi:mannose-6-phosphate isomerase-like protein (cupin superfamily)
VTNASRNDDDYCVSIATMPPGVVVPLHSHADHETFYILSGATALGVVAGTLRVVAARGSAVHVVVATSSR